MTRRDLSWTKVKPIIPLRRTSAPVFVTFACMLFILLERASVTTNGPLGTPEAGAATAVASQAARISI